MHTSKKKPPSPPPSPLSPASVPLHNFPKFTPQLLPPR